MPTRAYRTFKAFGVPDELLVLVANTIRKEALKETKKGNLARLEISKKSYREDIVIGDLYIIPPSVCKDADDFPVAFLASGLFSKLNQEEKIDAKMHHVLGTKMDKDSLKLAKEMLFTVDGKEVTLMAFLPAWGSMWDIRLIPLDDATLEIDLRDQVFSAQWNPALSSAFEQVKALSTPYRVEAIPLQQNIFKIPSYGNNYPVMEKAGDVSHEQGTIKAEPSIGDKAKKELGLRSAIKMVASKLVKAEPPVPKIRLTAAHLEEVEKSVLDPEEIKVLDTLDKDVEQKAGSDFKKSNIGDSKDEVFGDAAENNLATKSQITHNINTASPKKRQPIYNKNYQGPAGLRRQHDYGEPGSKENLDPKLVQSSDKQALDRDHDDKPGYGAETVADRIMDTNYFQDRVAAAQDLKEVVNVIIRMLKENIASVIPNYYDEAPDFGAVVENILAEIVDPESGWTVPPSWLAEYQQMMESNQLYKRVMKEDDTPLPEYNLDDNDKKILQDMGIKGSKKKATTKQITDAFRDMMEKMRERELNPDTKFHKVDKPSRVKHKDVMTKNLALEGSADTDEFCHNPNCKKEIKGAKHNYRGAAYCSEECISDHKKYEDESPAKEAGTPRLSGFALKILKSTYLKDILAKTHEPKMIEHYLRKGIKNSEGKNLLAVPDARVEDAIQDVIEELYDQGDLDTTPDDPETLELEHPVTEDDKQTLRDMGIKAKKALQEQEEPIVREELPMSADDWFQHDHEEVCLEQAENEKVTEELTKEANYNLTDAARQVIQFQREEEANGGEADLDTKVMDMAEALGLDPDELDTEVHRLLKTSSKKLSFTLLLPGQIYEGFYPELIGDNMYYPEVHHDPTPEDLQMNLKKKDDGEATKGPNGMGLGPSMSEPSQGIPLRKELNLRGPSFQNTFYSVHDDIDPSGLVMGSLNKKAGKEEAQSRLAALLKLVCGEIAGALMTGFSMTKRPMYTEIPTEWKVDLKELEMVNLSTAGGGFMMREQTPTGSGLRFIIDQLNDSEIAQAINSAWAQAAVWNDDGGKGFVYEVFVRAEKLDIDELSLTVKYIIKKNEDDDIVKMAKVKTAQNPAVQPQQPNVQMPPPATPKPSDGNHAQQKPVAQQQAAPAAAPQPQKPLSENEKNQIKNKKTEPNEMLDNKAIEQLKTFKDKMKEYADTADQDYIKAELNKAKDEAEKVIKLIRSGDIERAKKHYMYLDQEYRDEIKDLTGSDIEILR